MTRQHNREQVLFADTFKFCLSLYGHKLPVLALDISSDGTLLASGSADKNLKFWGLDFGDCHRSLFAHDDSVTQVGELVALILRCSVSGVKYGASCEWVPQMLGCTIQSSRLPAAELQQQQL